MVLAFGEDLRTIAEAEKNGIDAETIGVEEESMGKPKVELAVAIGRASDDAGKKLWGTIAGGACIGVASKIAGTVDTNRVVTTVVAGRTRKDEPAWLR